MTRQSLFPGVPFPSHAPQYVLPGLSLRQLRTNKDIVAKLLALEKEGVGTAPSSEQFYQMLDYSITIVALALMRNHPEVTEADVEEFLDMNNFRPVLASVMGQSGFKLVTALPGDAVAQAGELTSGS